MNTNRGLLRALRNNQGHILTAIHGHGTDLLVEVNVADLINVITGAGFDMDADAEFELVELRAAQVEDGRHRKSEALIRRTIHAPPKPQEGAK